MSSLLDFPLAPSVTDAVEGLQASLQSVASLVAAGHAERLSEAELLAATARVHDVVAQARAVAVTLVAEVRAGEVARTEGFTSTTRWLEITAGLSHGQSRAAVALGEKLQWEFEATRDAWLAGDISEGAVQVITTLIPRRLSGVPAADHHAKRTELETMALHLARTRPVAEVRRAIERAAIAADPAGADAAAIAAKESEFIRFTPVPDGVEVRGFLATETAAVVLTAFDQCHDAMFRTGELGAGAMTHEHRAGSTPGPRRQRRENRNAQILAALVTRLLDDGALGTKHAQRPHLTVTVHVDDYAAGLGGDVLLPGFGLVPVPNTTIDRLLCDAEIHPVLTRRPGAPPGSPARADDPAAPSLQFPGAVRSSTDPPWRPPMRPREGGRGGWDHDVLLEREPTSAEIEADTDLAAIAQFSADLDDPVSAWNRFLGEPGRHVLDVGRSFRTAPPKLRRALTVRDGGCAVPGCHVDASRCEAHHITHWEHHGDTSISNMVLLCCKHHHMVHEGRWRILRTTELDPGHPDHVTLVAPGGECRTRVIEGARDLW